MTTLGDPDRAMPPRRPADVDSVPDARAGARTPVVLVVDDSADMRGLLREVLEQSGYEVVTAPSSGKALTLMSERVPDLVITDLMMPGMSGFALRSLMLRRVELAAVPVIVLSAYWARPGETLDAVAVLTKPVDLDRLLEAVEGALATPDS
ncbi:MAG: response regulator [Chloroflexi bacterium]|nr:response regulator [Chloroflexota bacterium]